MMTRVYSAALWGVQAVPVEVEVHLGKGMTCFEIIGLPENTIKEGRRRIRAAIESLHLSFPSDRVVVNLAPADLPKEGARFDLAITVGILTTMGVLPKECVHQRLFLGELALDGRLRPCAGGLAAADWARRHGLSSIVAPPLTVQHGATIPEVMVEACTHLKTLIRYLQKEPQPRSLAGASQRAAHPIAQNSSRQHPIRGCMDHIVGQSLAKQALIISAAGFHSMLMVGPPGTGKTMLSKTLSELLPPLRADELRQVAINQSADVGVDARGKPVASVLRRPFRNVHHAATLASFLGRKNGQAPGEMALAHRGVLFLDELPEFRRDILESMRQPIEEGRYALHRAWGRVEFPARFLLIAAMNPCPCGYYGDERKACHCTENVVTRYARKVSGPILDRLDLILPIKRQSLKQRTTPNDEHIRQAIDKLPKVWSLQQRRFQECGTFFNSEIKAVHMDRYCQLAAEDRKFLQATMSDMGMSHRAYHRIIRVARTIADLDDQTCIARGHLLQAMQFRLPVLESHSFA